MNLISITNAPQGQLKRSLDTFEEDEDGTGTLETISQCARVVSKVSGVHPGSLGLHPAVYFYSERGRHIPDLLLGMLLLVRGKLQNNDHAFFPKFSRVRGELETYILRNKGLITQALQLARSAVRYERVSAMFDFLITALDEGKSVSEEELIRVIAPNSVAKVLAVAETASGPRFSDETKSTIFLRQAFDAAITCPICNGYVDTGKSVSYDHITRVQDGGMGMSANGQMTHPFCNTGVKN